jgi:hypothetical protein
MSIEGARMRCLSAVMIVASLGGCGLDETEFIPQYAAAYCTYYVSCADPAVLAFDGIDTQEECLAVYGPEIEAAGDGCKLARSEANKCLKSMEGLACPADATDLDAGLPPVCEYSWKKCIADPGDVNGENDEPTSP